MQISDLVGRIEKLIGAKVEAYQRIEGGYTPAARLRCHTNATSFFVKAGTTPLTSLSLRREISVYTRLHGPFLPKIVAWDEDVHEPVLILEDLSTYYWPPPWDERELNLVLKQIDAMHDTAAAIESFAEVHGDGGGNWQTIASDPEPFLSLGLATMAWLDRTLAILIQSKNQCRMEGNNLCHWDLRSDNICITSTHAVFVDWNLACLSNPVLDLGFLLPSLAYEGGPTPDRILPNAPEVAAWVAGYFAARAGLPNIPDAPRVRLVQRQQLGIALAWAIQ